VKVRITVVAPSRRKNATDTDAMPAGHHGWLHWINQPLPAPSNGRPNTDLWPDTSAYDPSELYPIEGLTHKDGGAAKVFSSRDPRTVRRHFHWMAEHGVDGAFLQRFVGQVDPEERGNRDPRYGGTRRLRDEVGRRVREAAEAEGRVWAIMCVSFSLSLPRSWYTADTRFHHTGTTPPVSPPPTSYGSSPRTFTTSSTTSASSTRPSTCASARAPSSPSGVSA
jgi:hypothetical protein